MISSSGRETPGNTRPLLPDGREWAIVDVCDLSPDRRRLTYLLPPGEKRYVSLDPKLDSDERRRAIADTLLADRWRVATPNGPSDRPPPGVSPWLTT